MKLKLKSVFVAALLASGSAMATPTMQSCAPMEILHSSSGSLSYALDCTAGAWGLKYVGSVPAGSDPVTVQYSVSTRGPDGSSFNQVRSTRLLSPAHLGQALLREAIVLENGALAMRDCKEAECSTYRPLGLQGNLAKASITVTPQLQALQKAKEQLEQELASNRADLAERNFKVAALESEVRKLQESLHGAKEELKQVAAAADASLINVKSQFEADLAGLSAADAAERKKFQADADAKLQTNEAVVSTLNLRGVQDQASLDAAILARDNAHAELQSMATTVQKKDAQLLALTSDLELLARLYKEASDSAFELLDKHQTLEFEKTQLEGTISDMHTQLSLANTKLEATALARELATQAAHVAHLDADTLHLANQKLGAMLNERDATIAQLNATSASSACEAPVAITGPSTSAVIVTQPTRAQATKADELRAELDEVLPELYALRYRLEKAESQRDEALGGLKKLQNTGDVPRNDPVAK